MRGWAIVAAAAAVASGSTLTTSVPANERVCFYTIAEERGQKVGFYFAVQTGGHFDIDWTIETPSGQNVLSGTRDRQGDYIFSAMEAGEYSFCFSNQLSSLSDKLIDFEVMVESDKALEAPAKPAHIRDYTDNVEESILRISGQLSNIQRTQKYFRTRENRNLSTVRSTSFRISSFSIIQGTVMTFLALAQVWIVRKFFEGPSRRRQV